MHLSARISDREARQLEELREARGAKSRSQVVRALIAEEHARHDGTAARPDIADLDELKALLTIKAREGNVAAMKELRALLHRPGAGGEPAKDPEPEEKHQVTPLDAIRQRARARAV